MPVSGKHCLSAGVAFLRSIRRGAARIAKRWLIGAAAFCSTCGAMAADEVFVYSTINSLRGINISAGLDWQLTTTPLTGAINSLGFNAEAGLVYYGDDTSVFRWNPALGSGPASHTLMNDFAVGPVTAPIRNLGSSSGAYRDGIYYVGSEDAAGNAEEVWALTLSFDGSNVVSAQPLNVLAACGCTAAELGAFGDMAALTEGGVHVLYGATTDISGNPAGSVAGRWRFTPSSGQFASLQTGTGGQMSGSLTNRLYSNVGQSIREVDINTGIVSNTSLFTTAGPIFDFSGGFVLDFGDAPDSYGAAFHQVPVLNPTTFIGSVAPDNEPGSLNTSAGSTDGSGDDSVGVDDEDAVNNLADIDAALGQYSLTVDCSSSLTGVAGWLDFNRNGLFDTNERNSNHPASCAAGQSTLQWLGIGAAVSGDTFLRLRASDNISSISTPTGISSSGEVEDHPVTIVNATSGGSSGSCPAGQVSHLYQPTNLPATIGPNSNTLTISPIDVSESFTVTDVNVLDITGTHTRMGDLAFFMRFAGVVRRIYGPSCGFADDFFISLDDQATGTAPCPATDGGTYPPFQSLDAYNGLDSQGEWEFIILDIRNGRDGLLENWELELCSVGTIPTPVPDKIASVVDREVVLTFRTVNTGSDDLSNVQISDNLDNVFGAGNYTITAPPVLTTSPAGFTINSAYDGTAANSNFLATTAVLAPSEQIDVQLTVVVDTIEQSATPGDYTNQAVLTATDSSGNLIDDLSGDSLDLSTDTDNPTLFSVDKSASVSGFVFEDTGLSIATSHDGIRQAGELGIANRVIEVFDATDTSLGVTQTDANGFWQISVAEAFIGQALTIRVQPGADFIVISETAAYANGLVTDGELLTSVAAGESISDLNIGLIEQAEFNANQSSAVSAGNTMQYAHTYLSPSYGELSFSYSNAVNPVAPAWSSALILDLNCNGVLDAGESVVSTAVSVVPGEEVCVILSLSLPSNVASGASSNVVISTDLLLADESNTGHDVSIQLQNNDVTTSLSAPSGRLVLDKTVQNITLGDPPGSSNTGLPGHTLEYRISYRNTGPGQISDLEINDALPAFTTAVGGSVACVTTPTSLVCTPAIAGDAVTWSFTGSLLAGEEGDVRYRVVID